MSIEQRQKLERRIAGAAIDELLASGFLISVYDGEETVLRNSTDRTSILAAMFSTDEEMLIIRRRTSGDATIRFGSIYFVYGNDGWDVISDYTVNLEPYLTKTNALTEELSR